MGGDFFKDHIFASHAVAACGSIALSSSLTHLIDTLRTLLQVGAGASQQLGLAQVLERDRKINCAKQIVDYPFSILDGSEDNYIYVSEALLAGIAAGGVEAVTCTPFEFLKLRKQVASASHCRTIGSLKAMQETTPMISKLVPSHTPDIRVWNNTVSILSNLSPKHVDFVGALKLYPWMLTGSGRPLLASEVKQPRDIISFEGWSALWRGLRSGIARDCVFGGVFFSTWQFFYTAVLNWKSVDINPPPRSIDEAGPVSPLASSLAAGISGTVAAAASHTFDTAKSRSQCIVTPKYIAMERKLLKWNAPGIWIERVTGMSPADGNIMFRGIWLRMARSGIALFAIVGGYLLAINHLL